MVMPLVTPTTAVPSPGPTRLRVADLLRATDQAADDVLGGRCDHLLPDGGVPQTQRWYTRIHGDEELDIWLISWVPGQPTELHDHGGSLGALTVLSGSLNEYRWDGRRLRRRRLDAGDQAGFPLGWVHDVVWAPRPIGGPDAAGMAVPPTLSVHAYSPPLTAMSYYEITERNTLRRQRTELTDQPEGSG
ncbi:cysteine dioxygenase [Mycobacterium tuberculosis]|uniref:cysteine dioxygenase n=1 Tax=Mycobacterium tuberculosis TaxID=1773 RepID=UPI0004D5AFFA|nr:cysteine dioxygenase family protein [Mycobacterium tuberculosis]KEC41202.1 hypothetical protein P964_01112 [Mycobacterium tuberculosis KT-0079]